MLIEPFLNYKSKTDFCKTNGFTVKTLNKLIAQLNDKQKEINLENLLQQRQENIHKCQCFRQDRVKSIENIFAEDKTDNIRVDDKYEIDINKCLIDIYNGLIDIERSIGVLFIFLVIQFICNTVIYFYF